MMTRKSMRRERALRAMSDATDVGCTHGAAAERRRDVEGEPAREPAVAAAEARRSGGRRLREVVEVGVEGVGTEVENRPGEKGREEAGAAKREGRDGGRRAKGEAGRAEPRMKRTVIALCMAVERKNVLDGVGTNKKVNMFWGKRHRAPSVRTLCEPPSSRKPGP